MWKYPFMLRFDDSMELFYDDLIEDKNGCKSMEVYARRWNHSTKSYDTLSCTIFAYSIRDFNMPKYKIGEVDGFSEGYVRKAVGRIRRYGEDLARQAQNRQKEKNRKTAIKSVS